VQLWILASEHEGKVPNDIEDIRFRLRDPKIEHQDVNLLIEKGFLIGSKQPLADASKRYSEERRDRGETEAETDKEPAQGSGHFSQIVGNEWLEPLNEVGRKLDGLGWPPWKWIQKMLKNQKHPGAIHEVLASMVRGWDAIENPYAVANSQIKSKDWNWRDRDRIHGAKQDKIDYNKMVKEFEAFWKQK